MTETPPNFTSERICYQSFSTEGHLIVNYRHVHPVSISTRFANILSTSAQLQLGVNHGYAASWLPCIVTFSVLYRRTQTCIEICIATSPANRHCLRPPSQYRLYTPIRWPISRTSEDADDERRA